MNNILEQEKLDDFIKENKLQPFRKKQIYKEIFDNSVLDFENITTIPKNLQTKLKENFELLTLTPNQIIEETKDFTKFSFTTKNQELIESVLMYHYHTREDGTQKLNRITLCVSSQVGCNVWCLFCVTWQLGFSSNLHWLDIIGQLLYANNYVKNKFWKKEDGTWHKVRNVVFMWMGEPLLNYENVTKSINIMLGQSYGFNMSKKHITISTVWIIPKIYQLIEDNIPVMLAVSLHAPTQELREKLIPIWKKYTITNLIKALDDYYKHTKNRIFHEYIMIKNYNDLPEHANNLTKLLKHQDCHINLIPYNENPAVPDLEESPLENIENFKSTLEKNNLTVTKRHNMGREEKWACGQLWYENLQKKKGT